ncbi:nucleotidyltransferase family protein [Acetivibrio cellulolyticus]|uniref:nucleotidyltransferase family protein n=1 Tax=Acetivibrio cellulolyticus TaxID=35830 RepID=UPI0002481AC2|nr:nucleotidyltransferase family protein [Acetivibrio cellulolyticus]
MNIMKVNNILVGMDETIKNAMQVMDAGAMGIVLVVDENKMLRGTVTDGDIRRAILSGKDLDLQIHNIMQAGFTYVTEKQLNRQQILGIFDSKKIKQLPVLNQKKQPTGIYLMEDLFSHPTKNNPVLIMAGGLGTRLRPLTDDIPKPMLKVGEKPILETIIGQFRKQGFTHIYISVNYHSSIIENYFQDGSEFGVNIEYIKEKEHYGTAGSISLMKKYVDSPLFVINGDILTNLSFCSFLTYHNECSNDITVATRNYVFQVPFGVLNCESEKISSIEEKPEFSFSINAGIYILNPDMVDYIPDNTYFAMTDLINMAIKNDKNVGNYPIREYWMDIGRTQDYYKANEEINKYFGSEKNGA